MRQRRAILALASLAACGALPTAPLAADATVSRHAAERPAIKIVAPMRARVGHTITIRGRGFSAVRKRNTVVFGRKGTRVAFAKPRRASKTKLVVTIPASVAALLHRDGAVVVPTRLNLRVITSRYGERSVFRHSPLVLPAGV